MNDSLDDVVKILKYGNNKALRLFSMNNHFTLHEILTYVDMDQLVTLLGLNKLILSKDELTDKYGRVCQLKYKNGLYVLVPLNLQHPFYKRRLACGVSKRTKKDGNKRRKNI